MEPLYTTQFAYTLEEYTKFNMEVMKTQKKIKILNIILIQDKFHNLSRKTFC